MTSQTAIVLRKLPMWRIVGASYVTVARNFGYLVRISWLWLLIMLPVYAAATWLLWPWQEEATRGLYEAIQGLAVAQMRDVIGLPALASIAVAWHRLVLREERVGTAIYLRLDRVVWGYALLLFVFDVLVVTPTVFALSLPGLPPAKLFALVALGVWTGLVISLLVVPRLSLMLPGLALGERLSAAAAWRETHGNAWRLAGAVVLCTPLIVLAPLPAVSVYYFGGLPDFWPTTRGSGTAVHTVLCAVDVVTTTIEVTLLSLAYRYLVRRQDIDAISSASR